MNRFTYSFQQIKLQSKSNYIFQYVKNRTLSSVYHAHDFYEIIYCLQGEVWQTVNRSDYNMRQHGVLLLRPGDCHCFIGQSDGAEILCLSVCKAEFEQLCKAFSPDLMGQLHRNAPAVQNMPPFWPYNETDFKSLTEIPAEQDFKLLLCCFLRFYMLHLNKHSIVPPMLLHAVHEMEKPQNLKQGIPAFLILSGYSQSHLARLVKKYFNCSLKQYVNELRLQKAYDSIILTPKSIEEICEGLGFASKSHFYKIFKTRFGQTPAALRRQNGIWTA